MISIIPSFNTAKYSANIARSNHFKHNARNTSVSFYGHTYTEMFTNKNLPILIHETSFFREPSTLEFIKSYVEKMFSKEKKLSVVVGACSTGEEVMSLKMLLPERTQIKGIDLGEFAVHKAKIGEYEIKNPKFATSADKADETVKYDDSYLAFPVGRDLTEKEKEYKRKFNKIFEEVKSNYASSLSKSERKSINFRIKRSFNKNFKFNKGNILELDKNIPQDSVHVITFRNALYHMLNKFIYGSRIPKIDRFQKLILEKFANQTNKALKKDGILVFGEDETIQGTDWNMVSNVLLNNGFKPIWGRNADIKNVWQKVNKN